MIGLRQGRGNSRTVNRNVTLLAPTKECNIHSSSVLWLLLMLFSLCIKAFILFMYFLYPCTFVVNEIEDFEMCLMTSPFPTNTFHFPPLNPADERRSSRSWGCLSCVITLLTAFASAALVFTLSRLSVCLLEGPVLLLHIFSALGPGEQ